VYDRSSDLTTYSNQQLSEAARAAVILQLSLAAIISRTVASSSCHQQLPVAAVSTSCHRQLSRAAVSISCHQQLPTAAYTSSCQELSLGSS